MSKTINITNKIQKGLIASVAMYEQALIEEQNITECDNTSTSSSEDIQTSKPEIDSSKILKKYAAILKRLERVKI